MQLTNAMGLSAPRRGGGGGGGGGGSGDPYYLNVSLLMHCDGANVGTVFTDNSFTPKTITRTGSTITTTFTKKFGSASIYFDAGGSWLNSSASADFAFGTGDFTVEYWSYPWQFIFPGSIVDTRSSGTSTTGYCDYIDAAGKINLKFGNAVVYTSPSALTAQVWQHVAITRASGQVRVFIDGVQAGSTFADSTNMTDTGCQMGRQVGTTSDHYGYIDDLRITKGVARYTANFTPPSAAFPDGGVGNAYMTAAATGASVVTSGNYKIATFTGSGSLDITEVGWNPTEGTKIDYLVVAGGGGGGSVISTAGNQSAGAGGAGGMKTGTGQAITAQTYTVTVGGGGAGAASNTVKGTNGTGSSIGSLITTTGGGGGGSQNAQQGLAGGSSGGSTGGFSPGAAVSGEGNLGANGTAGGKSGGQFGGGGGGKNAAASGATGGAGLASTISGSSVTYAGGGGAAGAPGGAGGGGAGSSAGADAIAGGTNLGGGGGGGGGNTTASRRLGATGGSGVVIIKWRFQ